MDVAICKRFLLCGKIHTLHCRVLSLWLVLTIWIKRKGAKMKKSKIIFYLLIIFLITITSVFPETNVKTMKQNVYVVDINGVINPVMTRYVIRGIEIAEKDNGICVIQIDTPGGLDSSMREIIQKIISSAVPVITYVYPEGSRSASAGVYIMCSSHIAAMSHSTNLGAAHPVMMGNNEEKPDEEMKKKMTNDAEAYIKGLAQKRKRNVEWMRKAVTESVSITSDEALKINVIDFVAKDLNDLLLQIKGRKVFINDKEVILNPSVNNIEYIKMNFAEHFLFTISNPNIAFILMMIGIYGLIYEFASPGAVLPGVMGGISLILALYSLGTLPINYAGLFLIIFSFILFILEVKAPTHGILFLGGLISFVLGSLMLIPAGYPYLEISKSLIITAAVITGLFFAFLITMVIKGMTNKIVSGKEEVLSSTGTARTKLDPDGLVFIMGELWSAKAKIPPIEKGSKIRVVELNGLTVTVEEIKSEQ